MFQNLTDYHGLYNKLRYEARAKPLKKVVLDGYKVGPLGQLMEAQGERIGLEEFLKAWIHDDPASRTDDLIRLFLESGFQNPMYKNHHGKFQSLMRILTFPHRFDITGTPEYYLGAMPQRLDYHLKCKEGVDYSDLKGTILPQAEEEINVQYKGPGDTISIRDALQVAGQCMLLTASRERLSPDIRWGVCGIIITPYHPWRLLNDLGNFGISFPLMRDGVYQIKICDIPLFLVESSKVTGDENAILRTLGPVADAKDIYTVFENMPDVHTMDPELKTYYWEYYEALSILNAREFRKAFQKEGKEMYEEIWSILRERMDLFAEDSPLVKEILELQEEKKGSEAEKKGWEAEKKGWEAEKKGMELEIAALKAELAARA